MAKQQNRDVGVVDWGRELLDLCYDVGLLIPNGRMLVTNQGSSVAWQIGDATLLIIFSPIVHQDVTHFDVIMDVVTLALGSRPRQGLVRVQANWKLGSHISCSWECRKL